jgi:hypothetical protein
MPVNSPDSLLKLPMTELMKVVSDGSVAAKDQVFNNAMTSLSKLFKSYIVIDLCRSPECELGRRAAAGIMFRRLKANLGLRRSFIVSPSLKSISIRPSSSSSER